MIEVRLTRTEQVPAGVFGAFQIYEDGQHLRSVYSMEDDWLDNQPNVSCIPAGDYTLRRSLWVKRHIETFEVMDVPGRSRILIHPANTEEDVEGCIGVGMRFGRIRVARDEDTGEENVEKYAVVASVTAFNLFMGDLIGYDDATIKIRWAGGLPRGP